MNARSTLVAVILACPLVLNAGDNAGVELTVESYSALRGGTQRGSGVHAMALLHSGVRSGEMIGDRPKWSAYVSALALAGRGPTGRYVGDLLAASNMEGHESVRLYSWWFEGAHAGWSLRAGALLADEEFAGTDAGGGLLNSAFGWPVFVSANTVNTGPAFYVAAPGVRLERSWGNGAAWRVGVYDGDSFDSPDGDPRVTRHGLHYQVGGDQGWFVMSEATVALVGGDTRLAAGGWLHTASFPDLLATDGNGDAIRHRANHGVYASLQQTVAGQPGDAGHIDFFVRAGTAPRDRNAIGWAFDTGFGWTGPLPGRPGDVLTLGYAHARFGRDAIAAARRAAPADPAPDFESVIELGYAAAVSEHLTLQPHLQFIRHPGGSPAQGDALVLLLRVTASY